MTHWQDIDNDYLDTAIGRIASGLVMCTGVKVPVHDEPTESLVAPFWSVDTVGFTVTEQAADLHTQIFEVASLYVHETNVPGKRKGVYRATYKIITRAFNFMFAHRNLNFTEEQAQEPIPYLMAENVTITIRAINEPYPGMALVHTLPFWIELDQEWL